MTRKTRFLTVGEQLYRQRRGILILRDCLVGHIPAHAWNRIGGRKQFRRRLKFAQTPMWFEL